MKYTWLVLVLSLFSNLIFGQNRVTTFQAKDGLPQDFIYSVQVDQKGYLWVGTGLGLSKFDGIEFINYSVEHGLAENFITCLSWEKDTVLIGHQKGGVSYGVEGIFNSIQFDNDPGRILHLEKLGLKFLVFAQKAGLFIGNKEGVTHSLIEYQNETISDLDQLSGDSMLVSTNKGIYLQVDTLERIQLYTGEIKSAHVEGHKIVFSNGNKVFYLDVSSGKSYDLEKDLGRELASKTEKVLIQKGVIYGYIPEQGIWILEKEKDHLFLNERLLGINELKGIYVNDFDIDREENVWVGTGGYGLSLLHNDWLLKHFEYEKSKFISLHKSGKFTFFGLNNKVYQISGHHEKIKHTFIDSIDNNIKDIYKDNSGVFWCATETGLEFIGDNVDKWKKDIQHEFDSKYVNEISHGLGGLWISTIGHGVFFINEKDHSIRNFTTQTGLLHNDIYRSYIDSKRNVWLATHGSKLSYLDSNFEIHVIDLPDREHYFDITSFQEVPNGDVWVSTAGEGLWKYSKNRLYLVPAMDSDFSYALFLNKEELWVGLSNELSRIDLENNNIQSFSELFNLEDLDFFSNSFVDFNEQILVAGSKGLFTINPNHKDYSQIKLPIYVKRFVVNGEDIRFGNRVNLPSGRHTIELTANSLRYNNRQSLKYQFRILGDLDHIGEISNEGFIDFHGLSHGNYRIEARSSLGHKKFSKWVSLMHIHIDKPFYLTWWFVVLVLISVVSAPFLFFKYRIKKLRKDNIKLEKTVALRSSEIIAQKNELEVQHNLMKHQQKEIVDSIQYAKRIQSAMLIPDPEVMNISKEFFVFFKPKDIVSGDFFWSTVLNDKLIITAADCTGHGVPGAFMSMLGISFLNQIVNEKKVEKPGKILDLLRERIIASLSQTDDIRALHDGIDISICSYDLKKGVLEFAGANNSLYLIRDNEVNKIKSDRMPISHYPTMDPFVTRLVDIRKGDCLYMFSDGYVDQFGGPKGKKYKSKLFLEFLLKIHKEPMKQQRSLLEQNLEEWMAYKDEKGNTYKQVDDIVVMGFRI